ncbi:hypothetical protein F2Q70_00034367 [Brassica cretica]|uniref:Uncharacterized protein n=1 Tax=Brassica cretica TaxID=69181 RepID=A0A8S9JU18_BRACR|nr:hypothetical protein F2Q70_00034367 [Brassica cretica]
MEKCRKDDNWMEVLDIKTQTWSPLLSHGATEFCSDWFMIDMFRGKIYPVAKKQYAYDPNKGTWEVVKKPKRFRYANAARFEEYNGKLESKICCAKIVVEKCHENEVWGKIEWVNEVLTVTSSYKFCSQLDLRILERCYV